MNSYVDKLRLKHDPFESGATAGGFFAGGGRQELLNRLLEHSMYGHHIQVVIGPMGSGKTVLAEQLQGSFAAEAECVLVTATLFMNRGQFLATLAGGLNYPAGQSDDEVVGALAAEAAQMELEARSLILAIDDAHEMSAEVIELLVELREKSSAVQLVLFGESQLEGLLKNALPAGHRASVMVEQLPSLGLEDSAEYVEFKLRGAAYSGAMPLTGAELGAICNRANGLPGTINSLTAEALNEVDLLSTAQPAAAPGLVQLTSPHIYATLGLGAVLLAVLLLWNPGGGEPLPAPGEARRVLEIPVQTAPALTRQEDRTLDPGQLQDAQTATPQPVLRETGPGRSNSAAQPVVGREEQEDQEQQLAMQTAAASPVSIAGSPGESASEQTAEAPVPGDREVQAPGGPAPVVEAFARTLLDAPDTAYAIQVIAAGSEESIQRFLATQSFPFPSGYYRTEHEGRPWFVALVGPFSSRQEADSAMQQLSGPVRAGQPWVRAIAPLKQELRTYQGG